MSKWGAGFLVVCVSSICYRRGRFLKDRFVMVRRHVMSWRLRPRAGPIECLESRCLLSGGYIDPTYANGPLPGTVPGADFFLPAEVVVGSDRKAIVAGTEL